MSRIQISFAVLQRMIDHARSEYPKECCGLLSGRDILIDGICPTVNQKGSVREFFVPIRELFNFFKELRRKGREHLGIYHSHPYSKPYPSARDISEFHYQKVSYWIVSLKLSEPEVRCFQWGCTGFKDHPFRVVS